MTNDGASRAIELFRHAFGEATAVVARAPGRLEVLGNHLDYNGGCVLSCAIDRAVYAALGPAPSSACELISTAFPEPVHVSTADPARVSGWTSYPVGVWGVLRERGVACPPFRLAVHGDVPAGAGLSSSAALEIATGIALRAWWDLAVSDLELARVGQEAERVFAGTECGLLDQLSSLHGRAGHLLRIDFADLSVEAIPLPAAPLAWVVTLSGVTHTLADSAYNERRAECEEAAAHFAARDPSVTQLRYVDAATLAAAEPELRPAVFRRARHVVSEQARVERASACLAAGDLETFGALLFASHQSSRDDFENSCPELDALVGRVAGEPGVLGARLTGGGFGGATLTLVRAEHRAELEQTLARGYQPPGGDRVVTYVARASDGAAVIVP